MYTPKYNLMTDKEEIINFIKTYSFGIIITSTDNYPVATHLPFVVSEKDGDIFLTSHFAKANKQWEQLIDRDALVIFSEPNAYISPTFYDSTMEVPTWNYIAVHVYGRGRILTESSESFEMLEMMIDSFERSYKEQWEALPAKFKNSLVKEIVAFQIIVSDIQGKKKISQNKKKSERSRIIAAFEASDKSQENVIAEFMKRNEEL